MKQFKTILMFEFMSFLKNKVFVGITIGLVVLLAVILSFGRISSLFEDQNKPVDPKDQAKILLSDKISLDKEETLAQFKLAFPDKKIEVTDKTQAEIKTLVNEEKYESGIIISSPTHYMFVVKNLNMYDSTSGKVEEIMTRNYRLMSLKDLGINVGDAGTILDTKIVGEFIQTGKDQMQHFFYTYILTFSLYMAILLYGQLVATSVASEKSSRAMELLITSAKPNNLMFGKVLGSGLAGLFQMVVVFGSSFVFFNLNKSYLQEEKILQSIFNIPLNMLIFAVVFFILGYFLYAFLYGAIGSLASKLEDVNTSIMPVTFLFIGAFLVVVMSMSSGNIDNTAMKIASYIPFSSPMAMFARLAMSEVSNLSIGISILILIVSILGVGILSAKIYRLGVLLYGVPPKLSSIIKILRRPM